MEAPKKKLTFGRKLSKRSVYLGAYISTENKREPVAIKIEYVKTKNPQLLREAEIYEILKGGTGIPNVISFEVKPGYSILVMPLLGPNLEALFRCCSGKFSLKTVLMLAEAMLNCIEFIHSKSILHRDIKPDNFLMGFRCNAYQVNVVDFGRAKKYQDLTEAHIRCRKNIDSPRNAIYASLNAHLGIEQSRRDDLESLGYVLMYFLKASLPWQELKAENKKQEFKMIGEKKVSTSIEELCEGCPPEFVSYFHYCRSLKFDEKPDYAYLKKLFRDLFISKGFHFDYVFDWTMRKYQLPVMVAPKVENGVGTLHEKVNKLSVWCIILLTIYVLFFEER